MAAAPEEKAAQRRIQQMAESFRDAFLLFTAAEADAFSPLQTPCAPEAFANALAWPLQSAQRLLDGLLALELVSRSGNTYTLTADARACLGPEAESPLTPWLRHTAQSAAAWPHLGQALESGQGRHTGLQPQSSEAFACYAQAIETVGDANAPALAARIAASGARHLLDLGCGPGSYARACLHAAPDLRLTLMDRPAMLKIARQRLEAEGLADRCAFEAGDIRTLNKAGAFDSVLLSNVLHGYPSETNQDLLKRIYTALTPGGRLFLRDFFLYPDRSGPRDNLLFGINLFLHTGGGVYTEDEASAWLLAAGFTRVEKGRQGRCSALLEARKETAAPPA